MMQISKQFGHANMGVTGEHYSHYHPDCMGQASDHTSRMLENSQNGSQCLKTQKKNKKNQVTH